MLVATSNSSESIIESVTELLTNPKLRGCHVESQKIVKSWKSNPLFVWSDAGIPDIFLHYTFLCSLILPGENRDQFTLMTEFSLIQDLTQTEPIDCVSNWTSYWLSSRGISVQDQSRRFVPKLKSNFISSHQVKSKEDSKNRFKGPHRPGQEIWVRVYLQFVCVSKVSNGPVIISKYPPRQDR